MSKYEGIVFMPFNKDSTNPYTSIVVEADSVEDARHKILTKIAYNTMRSERDWADSKLVRIVGDKNE